MIYSGIFSLAVGLVMIGQWSFLYLSRKIPELEHEPIRIRFHIAGEMVTALVLIVSGIALLAGLQWAITSYLISLGMLFYTLIVSPGYFAQQGEWKWVGIFAVLMTAGLISLAPLL
jgi:hypothetical protein